MGRAWPQEYAKYGSLDGWWVVPGIVPLQPPQSPTTPGTPPPYRTLTPGLVTVPRGQYGGVNMVVGLILV